MENIYSQFNHPVAEGIDFAGEVTLTQQHFKAECDINTILAQYQTTGVLTEGVPTRMPQFGDFTGIDYHAAQNVIAEANQTFMQLPAGLRYRFDNDPAKYIAFCSDEANRAEAEKLGLLSVPETVPEAPAEPVEASKPKKQAKVPPVQPVPPVPANPED